MKERNNKLIGGSDSPVILGFSPWKTPLQLWLEKTGREKEETTKETHPWLYWGKVLEPVIASEYELVTGKKTTETDPLIHPQHNWMSGTPDRLISDEKLILECKIARESRSNKDWGTEKDAVKLPYIIQVQHYMAITGFNQCDIAVLIGNSDFRIYSIDRDEELIKMIIDKCGKFYHDYIEKDKQPPPINSDDCAYLWPKDSGKTREAQNDEYLMCQEYKLLQKERREVDKKMKEISTKLRIRVEDFSALKTEGKDVLTFKQRKDGKRVLLIK